MRIGIDARLYIESGIGRYIRNLLINLQKIDKKNEYIVFILKKDFKDLKFEDNFHKVEINIPWYSFVEQIKFPALLNKYNLDLVHFPHFNIPIFYNGKFIVTIHNLIHHHFSIRKVTTHASLNYLIKKLGYRLAFKIALNRSKKIIAPSNFVKQQLVDEWKISSSKIEVTYEGVEDKLFDLSKKIDEKEIKSVLEKLNVSNPFVLY